ncbi:MAG TPA: ester cyclase [Euzebyales bacterium]|nr:ester cyclase [Euzebyales bacterium]
MAPEKNIALLRRGFELVQAGDLDASEALLAEDFIANLPGLPEPIRGRQIWRMGTDSMLQAFPDLRIEIEDIFGVDDKVAVRLRFRGTHTGDFQGIPATQRPVMFTSIEMYRFEGDKIAEEWVSPDMMGLMQQIAAPAEA